MRRRIAWVMVTLLAVGAFAVPPAAEAQMRGGMRNRGGVRERGFRDRDRGRHFRSSFSLWIGPWWDPWWWGPEPYYRYSYSYPYPYPYSYPYYPYRYYTPPVVTAPPVYEPQVPAQEPPAPQQETYSWYYCQDPPGYYPYVRECPKGWMKVAPNPEPTPPPAAEPQPQPPPAADQGDPVPEEYRWYYCEDPAGYYPYVRDCPKGWTEVSPEPVPAR